MTLHFYVLFLLDTKFEEAHRPLTLSFRRDTTPRSRIFDHHFGPSRLLDDPFFRRMPFSGSLESLRTAGVNGTTATSQETRQSSFASSSRSQTSEEKAFADDRDRFIILLDVSHFKPEEVKVKIADDMLIVEASHDEKKDEHGFVTRSLKRRYPLPKDVDAQAFVSELTKDGMLTIRAPKIDVHQKAKERVVPVQIVMDDPFGRAKGGIPKRN